MVMLVLMVFLDFLFILKKQSTVASERLPADLIDTCYHPATFNSICWLVMTS